MSFNLNNKKTFCILPWLQINIQTNGNFTPCCMIDFFQDAPNINQYENLNSALNDPLFQSMREKMLKDETLELCQKCYDMEKCSNRSLRIVSNEQFNKNIQSELDKTLIDALIKEPELKSIDLRFSNLCNFKCRTCDAYSSTSWYEDTKKLKTDFFINDVITPFKDEPKSFEHLEELIPNLLKIYILGGEPFINPNFHKFVDLLKLKNRSDMHLSVSTNFSHLEFKERDILKELSFFQNLELYISIDDIEKRAEIIRSGTKWESTLNNLNFLKTYQNIKFFITPVVSILNVFSLPTTIEYLINHGIITNDKQLSLSFVNAPEYYDIKNLNEDERKNIHEIYSEFFNKLGSEHLLIQNELKSVLNYFDNNPFKVEFNLNRKSFAKASVLVDKLRNERLLINFPELIGFFNLKS